MRAVSTHGRPECIVATYRSSRARGPRDPGRYDPGRYEPGTDDLVTDILRRWETEDIEARIRRACRMLSMRPDEYLHCLGRRGLYTACRRVETSELAEGAGL